MTLEELNVFVTTQANVGMEAYYWWCTGLMIIIHVGFLMYEVGATRMKNAVSSGVKNLLAFAFMIPTFWLFGWWIYLAFPGGFVPIDLEGYGVPWNVSMGPMLSDQATGVFWAAFTLFACTTASIFSGAVIERIRISAFVFLAVILGSVVWILAASWGWHPDGWLVTGFGFHDVAAAGCVHTVAGLFAFGVLLNLGPRVGKYNDDGSANDLAGHSLVLSFVGLLTLIVGFFGFLGACLIWAGSDFGGWINIYGAPATLSSFAFNTLMGLAGIFICAGGLDIWYPGFAFILGTVAGCVIIPANNWLHNTFKIDDCVGAVSIHGVCGILGMLAVGLFASGFPAAGDIPPSNLMGQIVGIITMALTGFVPGYVISLIMKMAGWLRVPDHIQEAGIDKAELGLQAYNQ
jgi:Amt family ammonium transporter